jgi:hypothetical protein
MVRTISFAFACSVLIADLGVLHSFKSNIREYRSNLVNSGRLTNARSCESQSRSAQSIAILMNNNGHDIEVRDSTAADASWFPMEDDSKVPQPLNYLVDVNIGHRAVVYEVTLGREMGMEIIQGNGAAVVGEVVA